MGRYSVSQRTKDSMFNATSLLKQWNTENPDYKKEMGDFFRTKQTKEFIETLASDDDFTDGNSPYVKSRASRGANAGTWMHPYLFIDFAMWLNPKFKLEVIKFVHDHLIAFRHSAGDNYNVLSSAVSKLPNCDYRQTAIALQWLIFDRTGKNLRQSASPEQLKRLADIEQKLAFAIDMGYIKTQQQLLNEMRRMYRTNTVAQLTP